MTTWTPPASTAWSVNDIDCVYAALKDPDTRDAALTYLDQITDPGLLYVLACRVADRTDPSDRAYPQGAADTQRRFIRNRV